MMKYHTTWKEVIPAILVALMIVTISACLVVFLGLMNPASLLAEHTFTRLEKPVNGMIRLSSVQRGFLKKIVFDDCSFSSTDGISIKVERISFDQGLLTLAYRMLVPKGIVDITIENPTISVDGDKLPKNVRDNGIFTLPANLNALSYRFTIQEGNALFSSKELSFKANGIDVILTMNPDWKFGALSVNVPSLSVQGNDFGVNGQSVRLYADKGGQASLQSYRLEGFYKKHKVSFSRFIAKTKGEGDSYPIDLSLQDFSYTSSFGACGIPHLSGSMEMEGKEILSASLSIASCDGSWEGNSFSIPTSSFAIRKGGDAYSGAFKTSKDKNALLHYGDYTANITSLSGEGRLNPKTPSLNAAITFDDAVVDYQDYQAELSTLSVAFQGSSLQDCEASLSSDLSFSQKGKEWISGPISMDLQGNESLFATLEMSQAHTILSSVPFDIAMEFRENKESLSTVRAMISNGKELTVDALLERVGSASPVIDATIRTDGFHINNFHSTLSTAIPFFVPFFDDSTTMSGNAYLYTDIKESGKLNYDFVLHDLKAGSLRFSCGSTGSGSLSRSLLDVDYFTLSYGDYRGMFMGKLNIDTLSPSGTLSFSNTVNGNELLTVSLSNLEKGSYSYQATTTRFPDFLIGGELQSDSTSLKSDAIMLVSDNSYPISFSYTYSDMMLHASTADMVILDGYLGNPLHLDLKANNLEFPETKRLHNSEFSCDANFDFTSKDDWKFLAKGFDLDGIVINGRDYRFSADLSVSPKIITVESIHILEGDSLFNGFLRYGGSPFQENITNSFKLPFTVSLKLDDGEGQYVDFYLGKETNRLETMLDAKNISLDRFLEKGNGYIANARLVGDTDLAKRFDMAGSFSVANQDLSYNTDISLKPQAITLSNSSFSYKTMKVDGINVKGDMSKGTLSLSMDVSDSNHISKLYDEGSSVSLALDASFQPLDSLLSIGKLKDQLEEGKMQGKLHIRNMKALATSITGFQDETLDVSYKKGLLSLQGDTLKLSYDLSKSYLKGSLSPSTGIGCNLEGILRPDKLSCSLKDIRFDLKLINMFMETPIVEIKDGVATGDIYLGGTLTHPLIYGQVNCDSLSMTCFYIPDNMLYAKNITLWADGSSISTARQKGYAISTIDEQKVDLNVLLSMEMDGFAMKNFEVDLHMEGGGYVPFYLPIPESMLEISASVNGDLHYKMPLGGYPITTGSATMRDAVISIGDLKNCPDWYLSGDASSSFKVTVGQNCKFIYPNTPSPMVSAILQEGQTFSFSYDCTKKQFDMQGLLSIRNGEIFYFQKNFYITEGNISLRNNSMANILEPVLNLRAKLRDFDASGNAVDIYLILNETTLSNFNPTFESTPAKSLSEIMSMLGQSILPSTAYGNSSLYRVASMASVATSMAQRMGWINMGSVTSLSDTIRRSLGLDMFSLHSNILQNILIDILPGSSSVEISPLARYLNNTSVFLGKYVGSDMFLQALFHLQAYDRDSTKKHVSFLTNDLVLDLEVSLDWETPLCTYSVFTQPQELSLIEILDTIGFSVSKRIVLR